MLLFGADVHEFKSYGGALSVLFQMSTFGYDIDILYDHLPQDYSWWAKLPVNLFYYTFTFVCVIFFLNIAMAIIISAYNATKAADAAMLRLDRSKPRTLMDDLRSLFGKVFTCFGDRKSKKAATAPSAHLVEDPEPQDLQHELEAFVRAFQEHLSVETSENKFKAVRGDVAIGVQAVPHKFYDNVPTSSNFVVYFSGDDLYNAFVSTDVANYFWYKYGPDSIGAMKDEASGLEANGMVMVARMRALESQNEAILALLGKLVSAPLNRQEEVGDEQIPETKAVIADASKEPAEASGMSKLQQALMGANVGNISDSPALRGSGIDASPVRKYPVGGTLADDATCRAVLESLFASSTQVKLEEVKTACMFNEPRIPWGTAKRVRRELGIVQFKQAEADGTIERYWRREIKNKHSVNLKARSSILMCAKM